MPLLYSATVVPTDFFATDVGITLTFRFFRLGTLVDLTTVQKLQLFVNGMKGSPFTLTPTPGVLGQATYMIQPGDFQTLAPAPPVTPPKISAYVQITIGSLVANTKTFQFDIKPQYG